MTETQLKLTYWEENKWTKTKAWTDWVVGSTLLSSCHSSINCDWVYKIGMKQQVEEYASGGHSLSYQK